MRPTWILLALSAGLLIAGEAAATGLQSYSRYYRRVRTEGSDAQRLRPSPAGQPKTMLIIGNSLLFRGLDLAALPARFRTSRFSVFGTTYYNWYYGLRRLYRLGMRPDYTVICMSADHFAGPGFPDQFSTHFLIDAGDIRALSRDIHAGASLTASLYLARFSVLYGTGPALRGSLLETLLHAPGLFQEILPADPPVPSNDDLVPILTRRLRAIASLCALNRSRFLYLIPPTREPGDTALVEAGRQAGVTVLHPIANYALPAADYGDDNYHLNERGAALFTKAVAGELEKLAP